MCILNKRKGGVQTVQGNELMHVFLNKRKGGVQGERSSPYLLNLFFPIIGTCKLPIHLLDQIRQIGDYIHDRPIIKLVNNNISIVLFKLHAVKPKRRHIQYVSGVHNKVQEFHFEKPRFVLLLGIPHIEWRGKILINHHVFVAAPWGHFHLDFATDHIEESAFICVIGKRRCGAMRPDDNIIIGTHTHGCLKDCINLFVLFKQVSFNNEMGVVCAVIFTFRVGFHES